MTTCQKIKIGEQSPLTCERFDLVIFDCDGTLVDSESMNIMAVANLLQECGLEQYTYDRVFEEFSAWRFSAMIEKVTEDTGHCFPEDIAQRFLHHVRSLAPEHMKLIYHAADMVKSTQNFAKIYVVSNGQRDNIINSLEFAGLLPFFSEDNIISGNMAPHPKPAPDLYLLAAERAGVSVDRTLVIEDSLTGVIGALAAKMSVWGYCGTHHSPQVHEERLLELGAEKVFHNMDDMTEAMSH